MAYTAAQLISAYTAVNVGIAPDQATTALLTSYAAQTQTGQMSDPTALSLVINTADNTTAVANTAYQFFTGKTPGQPGLAFLVNSATNPTDLNDPYYTAFNIENRYMNFAANLGLFGDGAATFAATYGAMSFSAFVTAIYEVIIGSSYINATLNNTSAASNAIADIIGRQNAFIQTGRERGLITTSSSATQIDIATKAVVVGYLLVEGMKADIGIYAAGANNFSQALINGTAQYNVNLLTTYSPLGGGLGQAVPGAGTSNALTTGPDNIAGGVANDTYNGTVVTDIPANSTFSNVDSINGGGGNDTLNVTVSKAGGGVTGAVTFPAAALTSVETVNIRSLSTTVGDVTSYNAAVASGTTAINSDRSTNAVTVTNLAAGASGGVIGDASTINGAFNFGYATAATPAVLTLTGGTRGGSQIAVTSATPSLTVNSAGSVANTTGFIAVGGATSLTINATAGLNASGFFGFTGPNASITVSGAATATAATSSVAALPAVNLGALEGTVNAVNAAGLTAGGIWAGIGANTGLNLTGSNQADMVNVTGGAGPGLTGTINGSGGTDMVQFNLGSDLTVGSGARFSSFETVAVTNAGGAATLQAYTPTFVSGVTTTQVLASTGSVQILGMSSGGAVTVSGNLSGSNAAGALSLMLSTAAGADSVTLNLNNTANPSGTIPAGGVVVSSLGLGGTVAGQVETLNIVSGGTITSSYNGVTLLASGAGPNFADPSTVVVTGSQGLNLVTGLLGHNLTVNAAGNTGGLNFNSTAGGAFVVTVTGTSVNDTITLAGAGQTANVLGGVGADAITITAGMGAVNLAYTAANHSTLDLTGTPGTSGTSAANVGTMDFIAGFRTGVDKIGASGVGATVSGAVTDRGSAISAAAVTTLLATANFFNDGISNRRAAQFDYAGGTVVTIDVNGNGAYETGDMAIFLAGVANVALGDFS